MKPTAYNIPTKTISRLRLEREDRNASTASAGLRNGQAWGERASYEQLRRLDLWFKKFTFPQPGTPFVACYDVAQALTPGIGRNGHRDAAEKIFIYNGEELVENVPDGVPTEYVLDWVEGALRVLAAVEAESPVIQPTAVSRAA